LNNINKNKGKKTLNLLNLSIIQLKVSQKAKCYTCHLLSNSSISDFKLSLPLKVNFTRVFPVKILNPSFLLSTTLTFFSSLHFPSLKPYHVFRTLHLFASSNPSHLSTVASNPLPLLPPQTLSTSLPPLTLSTSLPYQTHSTSTSNALHLFSFSNVFNISAASNSLGVSCDSNPLQFCAA